MKRFAWVFLGWLVLLMSAQAASFDCAKATSKIEKLICSNDDISKLDETLSKTYQQAIEQSGDKQKITREQRQWLKDERNACKDEECLKSAYKTRISVLAPDNALVRDDADGNVEIVFGKLDQVCLDAVALIHGSNKADFVFDRRPDLFSGKEWSPSEILNHEYTTIDIYNNGTSVVVLADTEMFRSADSRWLYVMQPEDFRLSQKSKLLDRSKIAQLSPANQVVFTNGKTTVPIWSDIWHHGSKNYIVMKEFYFATGPDDRDRDPSYDPNAKYIFDSLYVGILSPSSKKYDSDFKVVRLSPEMVCQINWK